MFFGWGRSQSYEQARRWLATDGAEGLPVLRHGRSLRCPTAMLWRLVGLSLMDDEPPTERRNGSDSPIAAAGPAAGSGVP